MSITATLSLAAEALKAQQVALQTTGHNIANSATPGFSRQRVQFVSETPAFEGGMLVGQGVNVAAITRIVDRFAEAELLGLHGNVGYSEPQNRALAAIQEAFPLSGGVAGALGEFFAAWSDLANHPAGTAERVAVVAKARALGESLAQTREVLISSQLDLDQEVTAAAARINILAAQIAELNARVTASEAGGQTANDLRDQRQTLLQELIGLTGATAREEADGQITVEASGLLLVGGARYASLDTSAATSNGFRAVSYRSPEGTSFDATAILSGGTIGSLIDARDVGVQDVIDRLDSFAQALVEQINTQHALGYDLTGASGGDFFEPLGTLPGAAASVRVSVGVAADPRLIAAAEDPAAVPGDNRNALAMLGLRDSTLPALGGLTLEDHFFSLVGDVGARAEAAQARLEFQQTLLARAQERRESVSGVNIDEEMTKLIQFQRAFEAASVLLRTADEMYEVLIKL
ncbi:MAG TPA: flagellar hook-associated protein FlgK [candidate division Zixibacteria bacterium]|nr:flagellar hook-associated protein FlgK [candidate division Zixibacteria bacterium]